MSSSVNSNPSQDFVPIKEVRDGVITLKDGSMRSIVMVSSLNFSLKSIDEQTSIIMQFESFLNALDFSIQIFIESKRIDIRPYIALLEERYKVQLTDLLKIQIREYISYIKDLTENRSIMKKNFYVSISYTPTILNAKKGVLSSVFGGSKDNAKEKNLTFEQNRLQLEQRVGVVQQGLSRCGLRSQLLGTDEVVELFYKLFNPGEMEKPIKNN